jgi:hypothetical protein
MSAIAATKSSIPPDFRHIIAYVLTLSGVMQNKIRGELSVCKDEK